MAKSEKGKGASVPKGDAAPLEKVFGALEERVERLSARLAELVQENRRLRGGLEETEAARDRLEAALTEAQEHLGAGTADHEKLVRFEEERDAVRGRIERLLKNLEDADTPES